MRAAPLANASRIVALFGYVLIHHAAMQPLPMSYHAVSHGRTGLP